MYQRKNYDEYENPYLSTMDEESIDETMKTFSIPLNPKNWSYKNIEDWFYWMRHKLRFKFGKIKKECINIPEYYNDANNPHLWISVYTTEPGLGLFKEFRLWIKYMEKHEGQKYNSERQCETNNDNEKDDTSDIQHSYKSENYNDMDIVEDDDVDDDDDDKQSNESINFSKFNYHPTTYDSVDHNNYTYNHHNHHHNHTNTQPYKNSNKILMNLITKPTKHSVLNQRLIHRNKNINNNLNQNSNNFIGQNSTNHNERLSKTHLHKPNYSKPKRRNSKKEGMYLWQILLRLLCDQKTFCPIICWLDQPRGTFKIKNPNEVARIWGSSKNNPRMSYDKMSRSMRQYYKTGLLKKVCHDKLNYCFNMEDEHVKQFMKQLNNNGLPPLQITSPSPSPSPSSSMKWRQIPNINMPPKTKSPQSSASSNTTIPAAGTCVGAIFPATKSLLDAAAAAASKETTPLESISSIISSPSPASSSLHFNKSRPSSTTPYTLYHNNDICT